MTSRPATPPTAATPLGIAVLSERIGAGGAADVFRSVVGGVPLAVKVLRPEFALDREMMDRFAQEVAVVDALRHPGIPECYGHGFTSDGRPFAAFALVAGETLRDRINRGPLLLADGLRILDDVLEILILAHQKGIAHRDIKPSNIMLGPGGLVHLLDFGLAKLFEARGHDEAPISTLGVPLGTPSYMAPEQALGIRVTNAADLFGLSLTIATAAPNGDDAGPAPGGESAVPAAADLRFSASDRRRRAPRPRPFVCSERAFCERGRDAAGDAHRRPRGRCPPAVPPGERLRHRWNHSDFNRCLPVGPPGTAGASHAARAHF